MNDGYCSARNVATVGFKEPFMAGDTLPQLKEVKLSLRHY
jgi:hypothetical protein